MTISTTPLAPGLRHPTPATGSERAVLEALMRWGPQTRSDIARRLGLTNPRMSQVAAALMAGGLIIETDLTGVGVGRPGRLIEIVPSRGSFGGTRIGEALITSCVTDLRATVLEEVTTPLPDSAPETVVGVVRDHAAKFREKGHGLDGFGVCLAGQVSPEGTVIRAPFLEWHGIPLKSMLETSIGVRTQVDNDLTGLTQDEHWFGIGTSTTQFAVLALGVGIGLGVVTNDTRVTSPDDALGLISHLPVSDSGQLCPRGHRGCARAMLSMAAIASAVSQGLGRSVSYSEAVSLARSGNNPVAVRVFEDAASALGRLLALIASIALPQEIVITGEAAETALINQDLILRTFEENRHPLAGPVSFTTRTFDPSHWARGAAARAIQAFAFRD